jgi:putative flippase GtrA
MGWLGGTVRRWFELMGVLATLASIAAFAVTSEYALAWVAIAVAVLLAVSFAWTARDEY